MQLLLVNKNRLIIRSADYSRFVLNSEVGCLRFCIGCGVEFNQSSIFGKALYCSKRCRADTYNKKARKTTGERNRNSDGTFAAH